jgi:hypothetical protein
MRSLVKVSVALGVLALVAGPVAAQGRGGPRGGMRGGLGGILGLLQNKSVQKELKLEKEDVDKVPDAVMAALAKVLSPKQLKRLKEIELQQRGTGAFTDPKIQKALKLTKDQIKEIREIQTEAGKEMRELFAGGGGGRRGNFEEMRKKMTKIRTQTTKKVMGVLKADQKKKWKEMTGEPFEIKFDFGRGGRGGRRGGGRQRQ